MWRISESKENTKGGKQKEYSELEHKIWVNVRSTF
jgi:hypothetical protein